MSPAHTGLKHWFQPPIEIGKKLVVRGIGLQERMAPCMINRPVGTGDWLCMAFSGSVYVGDGARDSLRQEPCMVVWPARVRQYYGHADLPFVHSWIHCDGATIGKLVRKAGLPVNRVFPVPDWNRMETPLRLLLEELRRPEAPDKRIAHAYLEIFFRTAAASMSTTEPPLPKGIRAVRDFLEDHLHETVTLGQLAAIAHCSEPYLCESFRKWLGVPPIDYLIQLRIHKALYYLHDTNLRVGEIAALVGYDDLFYFSRLFRQRTGLSPRAMRKCLLDETSIN